MSAVGSNPRRGVKSDARALKGRQQPKTLWPVVFSDEEKKAIRPAARGVRQRILLEELLYGIPINLQDFHAGNQYALAQFKSYQQLFKRLTDYGVSVVTVAAGPRGGVRYLLTKN